MSGQIVMLDTAKYATVTNMFYYDWVSFTELPEE